MSNATSSRSIVAMALVLCISVAPRHGDPAPPLIQLRLAREAPAPGLVYMAGGASGAGAYVQESTLVSDEDIPVASAIRRAHGLVIDIRITQEAASRLTRETKEHVGWRIAVLLAGQLVNAVELGGPPPGAESTAITPTPPNELQMFVDLPAGDAERIAAAVAARWPR